MNHIEYCEGGKRLVLEGERLAPKSGASLWYWFGKNHEWLKPVGVVAGDDEKNKVKENIFSHFQKMAFPYIY